MTTSAPRDTGPALTPLPFSSFDEAAPSWLNEPAHWRLDDGTLVVDVEGGTDFWRHTHYGFVRDNGHLLAVREPGDFVATVDVEADYHDRYDQAGLMVRRDAEHWIKCGIELDGVMNLSTVVTTGRSDWSVIPLDGRPDRLSLRVSRTGDTVTVEYDLGDGLRMHRLAWFPPEGPVLLGPMAAAPDGSGFQARFSNWSIDR